MPNTNRPQSESEAYGLTFSEWLAAACRCCKAPGNHHRAGCDWSAYAAACQAARVRGERTPGLARWREKMARIRAIDDSAALRVQS